MTKTKTKKILVAAVALLCANLAAQADVLENASADAMAVVKIANLTQTSGKVAKLAKDFGVDAFFPPIADPLAMVKGQLRISKGINDAGDAGIEFFAPNRAAGGRPGPGVVVMIPISNYAEFLTNFEGATTEGNLSVVHFAGEMRNSYVADWGTYAAVSSIKGLVENKPSATLKLSGVASKEAARQDFLLYANMPKINEEASPEIEKEFGRALADFDRDAKSDIPEKWVPTVRVLLTQLMGVARSGLKDSEAATVGLNISDSGINYTVVAQFKPDTYGAKIAADIKNTDHPLTVGIPGGKYFYFGGVDMSSPSIAQSIDDFTKPILAELNKVEGQEKAQKVASNMLDSIRKTKSMVFGMPAPTKIGQEALFQQVAVYDGDSKVMSDVFTSAGELAAPLLAEIKMPNGGQSPKLITDSPAKSVEGVSLTTWKLDMMPNKEDPNAMQMESMMNMFYGPDGLTYNFGAINATSFVFASCATDETIGKFIKAYGAKEDNLAKLDHVKVVTDSLPKSRMFEGYVSLDEIANAGVAIAATSGLPIQVELPPDLPPVGFTIGSDENSLRFDAHVPTTTVQSLIAAGMQVFAKMNQQRRGGI